LFDFIFMENTQVMELQRRLNDKHETSAMLRNRIDEIEQENARLREAIEMEIKWLAERRHSPEFTTLGMVQARLRDILSNTEITNREATQPKP
jgi:hypothetical protein